MHTIWFRKLLLKDKIMDVSSKDGQIRQITLCYSGGRYQLYNESKLRKKWGLLYLVHQTKPFFFQVRIIMSECNSQEADSLQIFQIVSPNPC